MSDRIGILRDGRLVQEGPPEDIYDNPRSEFAATFLGDANILRGEAAAKGIRLADGTVIAAGRGARIQAGGRASCAVRPERIRISATAPAPGAENSLQGRIVRRIFAGNSSTYFVEHAEHALKVLLQNDGGARFEEGESVVLSWSAASTVLIAPGDGA